MQDIKDLQKKILEIALFIDEVCRENEITYYIMGGTAIGAVRHKGFIPWDDDLDIFMTPENYNKFKGVFDKCKEDKYFLQEWKITDNYLEYAKVRMNGTTLIESHFKNYKDMHHGIYVDIMILHKCPDVEKIKKKAYRSSQIVTFLGLASRNWKPKTLAHKVMRNIVYPFLPKKKMAVKHYKQIYKYDFENLEDYCYFYFITKSNFSQGIFDKSVFQEPKEIEFEGHMLPGPTKIEEYLEIRYGDYMQLPPESKRQAAVHAEIFDTEKDYREYIN